MGGCTMSFQVIRCFSRDIPFESNRFTDIKPP
jgi:hypothetical protein